MRAITTCFDQRFNNEAVFSCVTMILLARLLTDPLWLPFNGIFSIAVGISQFSIDRFFEKPENKPNSRPERSFVSSDMVTKMNLCANHVRQNNLEKNQRGKIFLIGDLCVGNNHANFKEFLAVPEEIITRRFFVYDSLC